MNLSVQDAVCPPGKRERLAARLERKGVAIFHKGVAGQRLGFSLSGSEIGTDKTNDEGHAAIRHQFSKAGIYRLAVRYPHRGATRIRNSAKVFVWPTDAPILVVDVDGTLADGSALQLAVGDKDRSAPLAEAHRVMGELGRRFRIVYLTARPRDYSTKTREWLARHGFPDGPVLGWHADKHEWDQAEYKDDRLENLREDFDHVMIGIGDRDSDYDAYRENKLLSITIKPGAEPHTVKRGIVLPDWHAIGELFRLNPALADPDRARAFRKRPQGLSLPPTSE